QKIPVDAREVLVGHHRRLPSFQSQPLQHLVQRLSTPRADLNRVTALSESDLQVLDHPGVKEDFHSNSKCQISKTVPQSQPLASSKRPASPGNAKPGEIRLTRESRKNITASLLRTNLSINTADNR